MWNTCNVLQFTSHEINVIKDNLYLQDRYSNKMTNLQYMPIYSSQQKHRIFQSDKLPWIFIGCCWRSQSKRKENTRIF